MYCGFQNFFSKASFDTKTTSSDHLFVLNVAAGKAAMQVSTEQGGTPSKAIDGSTSSFFTTDTCTLTGLERSPWWYVNLLEPYMVQLVRLDFGKPCCAYTWWRM
ncbi:hypothetical protein J437_LFUL001856 [Ladona fulva]|uniref:Fucolectin tachylectin-4 pentraxin-1 domain-containing protein n=1 Tax=Ladona fulva TaxID=123851 RepID=A0A8K0JU69_LADFU|nr:hypothetical protein J437_LFUL001856 [Ladona fulva]